MKRFLLVFVLTLLGICFVSTGEAFAEKTVEDNPVADEMIGAGGITWMPKMNYVQMVVTVSRPDGTVFNKTFTSGGTPYLDLNSIYGDQIIDGLYTYELQMVPNTGSKVRHFHETAGLDIEKDFVN